MFVLALISSKVIAQENNQKMKRLSFSLGSIEAPTSFLIYHPDHATYWKANDKLLQEQLESQIKKTPGALLLVDTTNVYNHIFVYQSPQDLPMNSAEEKALDEVFRSASKKLPPDLMLLDYQPCRMYWLQANYNYYETCVHLKSTSSGFEKYTTTYLISDGTKTIILTFQTPHKDTYELFRTFRFRD